MFAESRGVEEGVEGREAVDACDVSSLVGLLFHIWKDLWSESEKRNGEETKD